MRNKLAALTAVVVLGLVASEQQAAQYFPYPNPDQVPYVGGVWYMEGDPYWPCEIVQRGPTGRAMFVNERGESAWGVVQGNRVWVPDWSDGRRRGLGGYFEGNRLIWANGTVWTR